MAKSGMVSDHMHGSDGGSSDDVVVTMLSAKIKKLRKKLKLSQTKFARGMGVNIRTVQAWEYDSYLPNAGTVLVLEHLGTCEKFQKQFISIALK